VVGLHHYNSDLRHYYWNCDCECGGKAIVYGGHLKSGHTQSCGCLISKGEEKISQILSENNIPFVKQYTFDDCRGLNNGLLRFDFAVFDDNGDIDFLIEYQGIQHYEPKSKFGGYNGLRKQQYNDMQKREYCKKHGILLVAIPYWDEGRITYDYIMRAAGY
jgi:hypothetical protein